MLFYITHVTKSLLNVLNTQYSKELRNAIHKALLTRSFYEVVDTNITKKDCI